MLFHDHFMDGRIDPAVVTYQGGTSGYGDSGAIGVSLGAAETNRIAVFCVCVNNGDGSFINALTWDGGTLTDIAYSGGTTMIRMGYFVLGGSTSGTFYWSGGGGIDGWSASVFTVTKLLSTSPVYTGAVDLASGSGTLTTGTLQEGSAAIAFGGGWSIGLSTSMDSANYLSGGFYNASVSAYKVMTTTGAFSCTMTAGAGTNYSNMGMGVWR